jgi:hypothetical protein
MKGYQVSDLLTGHGSEECKVCALNRPSGTSTMNEAAIRNEGVKQGEVK